MLVEFEGLSVSMTVSIRRIEFLLKVLTPLHLSRHC